MKRSLLVYALFAASAALLAAQNTAQAGPYAGTANPPPDTSIVTDEPAQDNSGKPPAGVTGYEQPAPIPAPKPSPARPMPQPAAAPPAQPAPMPAPMNSATPDSAMANAADGTDDGIVMVAPSAPSLPELNRRDAMMSDPDGDIVHPDASSEHRGGYGATIRARLLGRLSTATSQPGERFRARVASDVIQDGQILIPAGSEIEGTVVGVSSGRAFSHGSMHLRPETAILPDGSRFHIYAELSGAPGSSVHINGEGGVSAGSQLKKDGIEYGGAVGAGAITGAILGGPGGALAGTIIGAGVITVHLLVSHPQAKLDSGTVLLFTLNQPLNLVPAAQSGN
ncbi:MAG: hypothetical protein ABSD70_10770 [Terracidiphilus sp.]|jgi:hypothetical protein